MSPAAIQLTGPGIRPYQGISSRTSVTNLTAYSVVDIQSHKTISRIIKMRTRDQFCELRITTLIAYACTCSSL